MPTPSDSIAPPLTAHPLIEVRHSSVHGYGVFARTDIPSGTFLAFYEGRRYTPKQIARADFNDRLTYLFGLSDGSTIDGAQGGNLTRHLNHACVPNCEAVEVDGPRKRLVLRISTIRAVAAGEELFLDYALTIDDNAAPSDYPCFCGTPACRGDMVGR
ncbi:SET domain-containing protein-lysine N-methyltransferase [Rhodoferax koreense]|uniref:SET domain-containing protein-lysine N-methyltransferase n=1 Tax=Rhodoferax koreensis TaxID=1842727 RepID=A0A1P8JUG4_9BURK|nr:SET domain-containing protein-lysine N-methyltransferase [Rhodoferax koreense]APW37406.1 SET domain-containing protein-lysine N-methyltransferase [Rhodoferax koreense]